VLERFRLIGFLFDAHFCLFFFSQKQNTSHHIKCANSLVFQARTQQLSVVGNVCLARGCAGRMKADFGDKQLHNQLKAFETSFDYTR